MDKKTLYGITALAAVVLVIIAVSVFGSGRQTPSVSFFSPASESPDLQNGDDADRIAVTPETVQTVLRTLSRAENYSRSFLIRTFWEGGESESQLSQWQRGDDMRLLVMEHGLVRNLLFIDGRVYTWHSGSPRVFSSSLEDHNAAVADRFSGLLTYEEVLLLPVENILSAGYAMMFGELCIFVEYVIENGRNTYVNRVYVSVDSGLLVAAESFEGGRLIYSMKPVYTTLAMPSDEFFVPPM